MSQPALGGKGQVQQQGGEARARDEEGLEGASAHVADVGNGLAFLLKRVHLSVGVNDPGEEHAQYHAQPDEAREDGEPPVGEKAVGGHDG